MTIEGLEAKSKSKYVLEQILEEIKEGEIEVGDKLPSEKGLAEMTNVSRTSVREALAALRLTGIVESKGGKGTIVKKDSSEFRDDSVVSLLQKEVSPAEILEARKVLNKGAIPLLTKQIDENDIEDLHKLFTRMKSAVRDDDIDHYLSLNKKFHLAIFNVTGNDLIKDMAETLLSYTEEGLGEAERHYYYEANKEGLQESVYIHKSIINSLEKRDKEKLEEALQKHFYKLGIEGKSKNGNRG